MNARNDRFKRLDVICLSLCIGNVVPRCEDECVPVRRIEHVLMARQKVFRNLGREDEGQSFLISALSLSRAIFPFSFQIF
jgi:hypothetical protein